MQIQISWLLQKPTDLDLHCLQRQGISGFSRTRRVKNTFSLGMTLLRCIMEKESLGHMQIVVMIEVHILCCLIRATYCRIYQCTEKGCSFFQKLCQYFPVLIPKILETYKDCTRLCASMAEQFISDLYYLYNPKFPFLMAWFIL